MMKYSVIIPLYNKSEYIRKSIDSVLSQTYCDLECIIVDDGSTDGSAEIADSYSAKYQNVRVIHQHNSGVAIARNNGVKESLGDYICFLDADDWWEHNFISTIDETITKFPDAGIYGTNYYYYKNRRGDVRINITTGFFDYFKEYSKNLQMPLTSSSVCVPKKIFLEMSGFKSELKFGEDFDLWARIALQYPTVFVNEPLAYYNQDVPINKRAVGNLIKPKHHFLWNIQYLSCYEEINSDLKILMDKLRISNMSLYYASNLYHNDSKRILDKVNWTEQKVLDKLYFKLPIAFAKFYNYFFSVGSLIKSVVNSLK